MEKMKVEIMSRNTIKPSIPTPQHLRTFNLSLLDQDVPAIHYVSAVFFYPNDGANADANAKSRALKASLSKILLHFYPLAGQVKDAATIDCNDEGACFIDARAECQLAHFLARPDPDLLNRLVPSTDPKTIRSTLASTLLVQLTSFSCGGMAVAVSVSHKFADASSLCTFVQSWTAMSSREYGRVVVPNLVGASLLPPTETFTTSTPPPTSRNCTTKRFVFHQTHISNLKANAAATGSPPPTDEDIVVSIIMKCAAAASRSKQSSALLNVVNLRQTMVPPLPNTAIGNLLWRYAVVFREGETERLDQMVAKMKAAFANKVKRIKSSKRVYEVLMMDGNGNGNGKRDMKTYTCRNLCGYPLHEMDFGWGKPLWVSSPSNCKNLIVLLRSKWGAIEAWVTLDELEMAAFERDPQLLSVASLNPSALVSFSRM